ncbi:MAG: acyl-CoA desaturase [Planctomycetes bacterium]|nr:acyl-CoA desaturase [Planctomycetota bacterium]
MPNSHPAAQAAVSAAASLEELDSATPGARQREDGVSYPPAEFHWGWVPFAIFHVFAVPLAWWVGFSWEGIAWCVGMYYARMLTVCLVYHRYFSHRSYQMGRVTQFVAACLAQTTMQKGVLWWAAHHRMHHRFSDQPGDPHSPILRGFWYAHVGWIVNRESDPTKFDKIKDFARFPELIWLNRWHFVPGFVLAALMYLIGGPVAFVWGYVISTVVLWHGTFTINSITHLYGVRRYKTTDQSRNSLIFAIVTCGEGWHNNHHHYQHSAAQGFVWWQIDFAYYVLKVAEALRLVRNVVKPSREVLIEGGYVKPKASELKAPVAAIAVPVPAVAVETAS